MDRVPPLRIKLPHSGDAIAPPSCWPRPSGGLATSLQPRGLRSSDRSALAWEIFRRVPDNLTGVSTGERIAIVHPTFPLRGAGNVFVVLLLVAVDRYFRVGHGRLFALYVMGYCAGRFVIELLRDDAASEPLRYGDPGELDRGGRRVRLRSPISWRRRAGGSWACLCIVPRVPTSWPPRGKVGYIDPWADDDADAPEQAEITSTEPAVPGADELEDLKPRRTVPRGGSRPGGGG